MITRNAAMCQLCLDIIESRHTHDYVSCKCGEISLDGGRSYLRRRAKDFNNLTDLSEYDEEDDV